MIKISTEDGDLFKMAATAKIKSEKIWVRDMAMVKINKMAEKLKFSSRKKEEKKRQVLHVRVFGIRQSV